jgi:hypothetical protein
VEDSSDEVTLTFRAFKKNNILNEMIVARHGTRNRQKYREHKNPGELRSHLVLLNIVLGKGGIPFLKHWVESVIQHLGAHL